MNSVSLNGTIYGNISEATILATPPADAITERITNFAGTQFYPLAVENPQPGYSYFIVKVPTNILNDLNLHDLPPECVFNIASNLSLIDLKSLGGAFKNSKDYSKFMSALYKTYCLLLEPRIIPLKNQGTLISTGGTTGKVFFTGFDKHGICNPKPSMVVCSEISSLTHCPIKSVFASISDLREFNWVVHTENEDVFFLRNDKNFFKKINKNVKQVICREGSIYLRKEDGLYRYMERLSRIEYYDSPNFDNMEHIAICQDIFAVKYKDGSGKILDWSERELMNFNSVDNLWHNNDFIFVSSNDKFFRIHYDKPLKEFPSLEGKKVIAVSDTGRFVCTEEDGWWAIGQNNAIGNIRLFDTDYIQITTLNNISHAIEIDARSSLFLADGKLYYSGSGDSRKLVDDHPQDEYPFPIECIRTMGYSIKHIWSNGSNIWFSGEGGVYQLIPDQAPLLQFLDMSAIGSTCKILEVWNQICTQGKNNYIKDMELAENSEEETDRVKILREQMQQFEIVLGIFEQGIASRIKQAALVERFESERKEQFAQVRHMIASSATEYELLQKIETLSAPFPEVLDFQAFLKR